MSPKIQLLQLAGISKNHQKSSSPLPVAQAGRLQSGTHREGNTFRSTQESLAGLSWAHAFVRLEEKEVTQVDRSQEVSAPQAQILKFFPNSKTGEFHALTLHRWPPPEPLLSLDPTSVPLPVTTSILCDPPDETDGKSYRWTQKTECQAR